MDRAWQMLPPGLANPVSFHEDMGSRGKAQKYSFSPQLHSASPHFLHLLSPPANVLPSYERWSSECSVKDISSTLHMVCVGVSQGQGQAVLQGVYGKSRRQELWLCTRPSSSQPWQPATLDTPAARGRVWDRSSLRSLLFPVLTFYETSALQTDCFIASCITSLFDFCARLPESILNYSTDHFRQRGAWHHSGHWRNSVTLALIGIETPGVGKLKLRCFRSKHRVAYQHNVTLTGEVVSNIQLGLLAFIRML